MRTVDFLKSLRAYVEALVHPSARMNPRAFSRHFFFIATRLAIGLSVLAALPVFLALRGVPSFVEALTYAWFLLPLFLALYVSRTGALEQAHVLSAITFAAPLGLFAGVAGLSPFLLWAALLPIEALLFSSRRAAVFTGVGVLAAFGGTYAFAVLVLPPAFAAISDPSLLGLLAGSMGATHLMLIAIGARAIADAEAQTDLASAARNRLIAQHTGELVTSHGRNGTVTFASPAAERLLGTPSFRLMGHGLFDRVHVADRPAFLTALSETAIKKKPVTIQYRLRREVAQDHSPQASFIWVESRCQPDELGGDHTSRSRILAVTRDIDGRKLAELALEEARGHAEQANDAKYRFLATVSHELRTPLNAIIGFSEILLTPTSGPVDAQYRQDYAKLIRDSGEHLLAVVNSILDVSQIESGQFMIRPRELSVASLIESSTEIMTLSARQKDVRLAVNIDANLPAVVADERAVRQIVLNLLSNAIKFTGNGGSITVGARLERGELLLSVSDSGIGIAEGDLKQIGNPFFQVHASYDRPYEGSGLGLSVVKGLVELHGGRLDIASRLGEGTKVTVRLPLDCRRDQAVERSVAEIPQKTVDRNQYEKVKRRA